MSEINEVIDAADELEKYLKDLFGDIEKGIVPKSIEKITEMQIKSRIITIFQNFEIPLSPLTIENAYANVKDDFDIRSKLIGDYSEYVIKFLSNPKTENSAKALWRRLAGVEGDIASDRINGFSLNNDLTKLDPPLDTYRVISKDDLKTLIDSCFSNDTSAENAATDESPVLEAKKEIPILSSCICPAITKNTRFIIYGVALNGNAVVMSIGDITDRKNKILYNGIFYARKDGTPCLYIPVYGNSFDSRNGKQFDIHTMFSTEAIDHEQCTSVLGNIVGQRLGMADAADKIATSVNIALIPESSNKNTLLRCGTIDSRCWKKLNENDNLFKIGCFTFNDTKDGKIMQNSLAISGFVQAVDLCVDISRYGKVCGDVLKETVAQRTVSNEKFLTNGVFQNYNIDDTGRMIIIEL